MNLAVENVGIGRGLCAIRAIGALDNFLVWSLTANKGQLDRVVTGSTYDAVSVSQVGVVALPLPPPEEQRAIAAFLGRETGKIDALMEEQRRLIELLKEKRQAVISHAVTKGLKASAPMEDSVIHPGDPLPEGWTTGRLSTVCKFRSGKAHEQVIDEDGPFVCVTARFVSTQGVARKYCTQNFSAARKGDILMVMSDLPNGRALARAFFVIDDTPYAVNQRVCVISAIEGNPRFFFYQLNRNEQLLRHDDGVNQTHLPNEAFTKLQLHLPPLSEQDAIVAFLDAETSKIDTLVDEAETGITLLQERRAALISAAVTGKIDVREFANHEAVAA